MFLKHLSSKVKEKLPRHHSRSRSPSLREGPEPSLQNVQKTTSTPSDISSATDSPQKASDATNISQSRQSLPILEITKPASPQGLEAQDPTANSTLGPAPDTRSEKEKSEQLVPEMIWDRAYDALKIDDAALVQAYERILTSKLQNTEVKADVNVINQHDKEERRSQMHQLVKDGLDKISKEANVKSLVGSVLQTVNLAQNIVTEVVKDVPQAAIPWAAVCLSLELLANPISETEANCKGISHVVEQMNWYCELAGLLFSENPGGATAGIQQELQTKLIDLYKKLLSFELKSICSYYRHRALIFLGDLIKLDDWEGSLKAVQNAEAFFNKHVRVFQSADLGQDVKQLVAHAKNEQEYRKTDDDKKCLRDLYITDPRMDKSRIESTKGGLIQDSYRWILNNSEFKTWLHDDDKRLLWPFLISHIREKYDPIGNELFEGPNAWYSLANIFRSILQDERLTTAYVIIDGLDECTTGLDELLALIKEALPSRNVKWILSSRNWANIRESLEDAGAEGVNLSLEMNATVVAAAVNTYISYKASKIPLLKQDAELTEEVCNLVREKANGTFLWVAIVFQELQHLNIHYDDRESVLERLNGLPKDLTELYDRMLHQIGRLEKRESELCESILGITVLAYQPLRLQELATLASFKGNLTRPSTLQSLIHNCGSFLTVKDEIVYFIHQSSKEYLTSNSAAQSTLFPNGIKEIHHKMAMHSINAMEQKLCRNIYKLNDHAIILADIKTPEPDPLISLRYPCSHWLQHICDSISNSENTQNQLMLNDSKILTFLKKHILHWLEVMSLMRNPPGGIPYISRFGGLLERYSSNSELSQLVYDIRRFTQHNSWIIYNAPLQIYLSGILFSPKLSIVRTLFEEELLSWITTKPLVGRHWSLLLQTLEVKSLLIPAAISSDNKIAVYDYDTFEVKVWDIASGTQIQTLKCKGIISQLIFSCDSNRILAAQNGPILSWDVDSGALHRQAWSPGYHASLSRDGMFLASHTSDSTIQIQNSATGAQVSLVNDKYDYQGEKNKQLVKLSNNAKFLAFGWDEITIWDVAAHKEHMRLNTLGGGHRQVCFSTDSELMAWESGAVQIWDLATEREIQILHILHREGHYTSESLSSLEFSTDSKLVAGGCWGNIWIWNVKTGTMQTHLDTRGQQPYGLAWSPNSKILASTNFENITIWDMATSAETEDVQSTNDANDDYLNLSKTTFSHNPNIVATISQTGHIKVWDISTDRDVSEFMKKDLVNKANFPPDPNPSDADNGEQNVESGDIPSGLQGAGFWDFSGYKPCKQIAFSNNGGYFAAITDDITIWKTSTGEVIFQSTVFNRGIADMAFSNNAQYFSLLLTDRKLVVWDITTGDNVMYVKDHICENDDGEEWCKCDISERPYPGGDSSVIAISNNGRQALVRSPFGGEIWISTMGEKRTRLILGSITASTFGSRESYIGTARGFLNIKGLLTGDETPDSYKTITEDQLRFEGYGLSADRSWITWNEKKILWLPVTYRPLSLAHDFINMSPLGISISAGASTDMDIRFSGPPPV
ncbi:NACHT domain-containing protein [Trichoderma breve]|uniref:NACHT domain-containing protein n=1 Tax=Trichoderma breve TaxID=2034170 RepID=A0A9W9B7F9_9HYPO|nr:NACHT domain-containing protein [Trichoderma breve]KAJ4854411.1 NACHT domain-containing protein [Trichoderma breve]